jgi:hypothetical protein
MNELSWCAGYRRRRIAAADEKHYLAARVVCKDMGPVPTHEEWMAHVAEIEAKYYPEPELLITPADLLGVKPLKGVR